MKVGVEGIPLFGERSGVGQYSKRLIEAASQLESDIHFEVIRQLMPHRKIQSWPIKPNANLTYRITRWLPPILYYQSFKRLGWTLPYDWVVFRRYKAVLFLNFVSYPLSRKSKSIIFIHDLSYIYHKQYVSPKNQEYLEKFVPRSIDKATKIVAISKNTRREISKFYGIKEESIPIISPAVDHKIFYPRSLIEIAAIKRKFRIERPYILSVGTIEPRKNLIGVLNAFDILPETMKQKYSLVLVGGKGWLDEEITTKFNELSKRYSIIKTGYVEDMDLPALYSGAKVFLFPSFYEGFGIPPLEAMACGVPVITSDNSSLPEVVGSAAIKIKAEDTKSLALSIEKVLTNKQLSGKLSRAGLRQASKFSWDKSAQDLLELLKNIR